MKKNKFRIFAAVCILTAGLPTKTFMEINPVFFCMKNEDSLAIRNDVHGNLYYTRMIDSNGEAVCPYVTQGYAYLPFRYLAEMMGLREAADSDVILSDGQFRFQEGTISIGIRETVFTYPVDQDFDCSFDDGTGATLRIYNVSGTLYFPIRLISYLTGGQVTWQDSTGNIYYANSPELLASYVNLKDGNALDPSKKYRLGYDYFHNNLTGSDLYLLPDGQSVSSLSKDAGGGMYLSAARSGDTVYGVDAAGIITKKQAGEKTGDRMIFTTADGLEKEVLACTLVVARDTLYGIEIDHPGKWNGKIFACGLDGANFRYLDESRSASNLIFRTYNNRDYLYYVDATNYAALHMIELATMDDYEMFVCNSNNSNVIMNVSSLNVGNQLIAYLDYSRQYLNILHLPDCIDACEMIKIRKYEDIRQINSSVDGRIFHYIAAINYDNTNDILYFLNQCEDGTTQLYYMYGNGNSPVLLKTYGEKLDNFSLFQLKDGRYVVSIASGQTIYTNELLLYYDHVEIK